MSTMKRSPRRTRFTVAGLVLVAVVLPLVAHLGPLQNAAWLLWLSALALIVVAATVSIRSVTQPPRRAHR